MWWMIRQNFQASHQLSSFFDHRSIIDPWSSNPTLSETFTFDLSIPFLTAYHSGKGACVYATYRDRSVCAVVCSRDCITDSICLRFLFALRCCLNHSLFYPDDFVSCVCRVLNIDEGTEISDRVDMHHASYQSTLSSTHHPEISSSTRKHSDFIRRRSYTPYFTLTSLAFAPQLVATLVAGPLITTLTTNSCTLKRRRRNHHNHSNLA